MSRSLRPWAAILLTATCGCSRDAPSGVTAAFAPPPVFPIEVELAPAPEYRAPRGRALALEPASAREPTPSGASALRTGGDSPATLLLRGPFDLRPFDALSVRVWCARGALVQVRATVRRGTQRLAEVVTRPVLEGEGWCWFRVPLPRAAFEYEQVDDISLELDGRLAGGVLVEDPVLEWGPPQDWREALGGDPLRRVGIELAGEGRRVSCLRPDWVLRARVAQSAGPLPDGAQLGFAFGSLGGWRGKRGEARLRVTTRTGAGEPRVEELALPRPDEWFEARIALEASGAPLEVAIELAIEGPGWLAAAVSEPAVIVPQPRPPTVVLVTSDTHRGDHLGSAGLGVEVDTPALDRLAARGVRFTDCFASSNVTLPSHAAMLTGVHPRDTGVTNNNTGLAEAAPTLAEAFRARGYHTLAVTSVNLLSDGFSNLGQGFERSSAPRGRRSAADTVALGLRWLDEASQRPVFLWVHVFDAHIPYEPDGELRARYYDPTRDPCDPSLPLPEGMRVPRWLRPCVRDAEFVRALYKGEVTGVDAALGALLEHPRVRGAVVAVTGDHGEVLGAHGIWWEHKGLYPDTLHVPLIVAAPGLAPARVDAPVLNVDLGRTLLDLAGLRAQAFGGADLFESAPGEQPRFALGGNLQDASIDFEGWHLILQLEAQAQSERHVPRERHQVELYERRGDPRCERDRARDEPAKTRELRGYLVRWLAAWNGGRWTGELRDDAATARELAELGYASSVARDSDAPLFDEHCSCARCAAFR